MKKTTKRIVSLLLASLFVLGFAWSLAACTPTDTTPTAEVSVIGGTGSGTYKMGEECTVTATVPDGYSFVEWTVYGVSVSKDRSYTFTVDFDIELTAVFAEVEQTLYTIVVHGGTINGTGESTAKLPQGSKVSVKASESQARKFTQWVIGGKEFTQNPYEFTVTGNLEITAQFDEYCMISVSGGTVSGERSKIVAQGSEVTVKANEALDGQFFVYWYTLDEMFNEVIVSDSTEYTFKLNVSTKIYAKFKYAFNVEVVNGTIKGTDENSAYVLDGDNVTIVPNAAPSSDLTFIGWYVNGVKVSIAREHMITVTQNMHYEARYGELRATQLPMPDASGNDKYPDSGLIYRESGGAVALDRLSSANNKTMFVEGAEYAAYKLYTSRTANKDDSVGELHLVVSNETRLYTEDRSAYMTLKGELGNLYFDGVDFGRFQDLIRKTLGYEYCSGQTYYFGVQMVAAEYPSLTMEDDYAVGFINSEISEIGSWGYCESPGSPVGQYTIKVENGFIDGNLTEVTAGHGSQITAVATLPTDDTIEWVFLGWKEVTQGDDGEVLSATLSSELNYTFAATKNMTIRAVFADRSTVPQIPLPMPNNSENKLIYEEGAKGSSPIALDRNNFVDPEHANSSSSMFGSNVDYVIFYVYDSPDADKFDYIASFRMYVDINKPSAGGQAFVGWFTKNDGTGKCEIIRGNPNNYYIDGSNRPQFRDFMRTVMGDKFSDSKDFYFAAQAITNSEDYLNSEISVIGTNGIRI